MKVKSSMHKGAQWMPPDTSLKTLANTMLQQDIGAIPIGENDRLIGMVTDRDITVRAVANGKDVSTLTARDVMTKGIFWGRDNDDVSHAANVMQSNQIRRLPVIDKNKRLVGILSLGERGIDFRIASLLTPSHPSIRSFLGNDAVSRHVPLFSGGTRL
ncbi:MAG: CBS domain-containing protein [Xanthobacteraceae bacterium]